MESNVTLKANEARISTLKSNDHRTEAEDKELQTLKASIPAEKKLSESRAEWRTQANALLDTLNENEWGAMVEFLRAHGFSGMLTSYPNGTYGHQRGEFRRATTTRNVDFTAPEPLPENRKLTPEERKALQQTETMGHVRK